MSDIKPPAQPQRTQSAEEFYKVWIAQHPKLLGKSVTWPISVCLFEFAEAYAQSLKQAAAPTEPVADPSKEELVIEIARELYDRFVMGGWEPQDAYPQIRKWLRSRGEAMKDNVQGCPRCGHNWKFGEINKETCGFHQCGCRHEWHAIPRMSAVPERGAPPEKEK